MDASAIAAETGWTVHHEAEAGSTNDLAGRLVARGALDRTAVVADRQTAGRGRAGRRFASPPGGLYVSLVLSAPPFTLPAGIVSLVALAGAEAIEATAGCGVQIKWPNDLWIDRRKVGGILLEAGDTGRPVVAGIGVNVDIVPAELAEDVRSASTSLSEAAGRTVQRDALLRALLASVDRLRARGAEAVEAAWRGRLALIGEPVTCRFAGDPLSGVLEDVSLRDGLLLRDGVSGPVWRQAEHVQDLRPAGRTIS